MNVERLSNNVIRPRNDKVMNVDSTSFNARLLTILDHIARSHFVTFDFELSGIPAQRRRDVAGKQDLEERYQELKQAAEKYHILQVGLSCVEEDLKRNKYLIRTYNFNISPLIGRGLGIDREFTYSASAVDFLLNHGFQLDTPIRLGVPYLTRSEIVTAEERAKVSRDKNSIPDMAIDPDDKESLDFMQTVRDDINLWLESSKPEKNQCLIEVPPATHKGFHKRTSLSRYEKRLVHQLVRSEYPKLSTQGRGESVQVLIKGTSGQVSQEDWIQRRHEESMFNQTGFSFIAEALIGGDLSGIKPNLCGPSIEGVWRVDQSDMHISRRQVQELKTTFEGRKTILVGHNCFLDLIYFHKTFIGELPETLKEFQSSIHEIFPLLIDTKYMATHGPEGALLKSAQLFEIDEALSNQQIPFLEIAEDHPSYSGPDRYHEAGFDSYATAKVMLRLAGKLGAEVMLKSDKAADLSSSLHLHAPSSVENVKPKGLEKPQKSKNKAIESASGSGATRTKYASPNYYEQLRQTLDEGHTSLSAETPASSSSAVPPATVTSSAPESASAKDNETASLGIIPPWNTDFWKEYGNKLRVYGTIEEVCDLTGEEHSAAVAVADEEGGGVDLDLEQQEPERTPSMISSLITRWKDFVV